MNIVCDKVLLSAAIDGVSKAVTMRSAIPVLEGILLKAEGFQLNLTGYDLEMGIVTTIEANVKEAGEVEYLRFRRKRQCLNLCRELTNQNRKIDDSGLT